MLGFTSSREPVKGAVAREIRETLERIAKGTLSSQDKASMAHQNSDGKYVLIEE